MGDGATDRDRLVEALELARAKSKPVVMMKVGRSAVGAEAAQSHTASLAGSDAVYDAAFRQYGVYRAQSVDEMFDVTYACAESSSMIWTCQPFLIMRKRSSKTCCPLRVSVIRLM